MKCPVFLCLLLIFLIFVEDGRALNCVAAHPLSCFLKNKTKQHPNSLKLTYIACESNYL